MDKKRKIVIVGATSAIAEHCARLWVKESECEMILIGRSAERLEPIATDLRIRNPQALISIISIDLMDPNTIQHTINVIFTAGAVDIALIAHGTLPDQAYCQNNLSACSAALNVNAISPVLFAEALATHMERVGSGTLGIIGSVAGDRGRKSIYVYGAAKGLIARYAQGLQHRLARTPVRVVLIKPGPTDTPMTAHMTTKKGALAPVEDVAKDIVQGMAKGKAVIYTPFRWQIIMLIVQHIPSFIFNKLDL